MLNTLPAGETRGPFYAMRFRNFRLFFIGQIISVIGTWMQTIAQQWLVYQITGYSPLWLGLISGANAIPYVIFSIWGGQVADKHSRRDILIWTQAASMIMAFVLWILVLNGTVNRWDILVLAVLGGAVNAFNMPAQQAFVTDIVEEREAFANAIALNSLRFNLGRVLGPMLAGIILVRAGAANCFLLNGISFVAVIICLFMMKMPTTRPQMRDTSLLSGFRYIFHVPSVLRVILTIGLGSLLVWPVATLYPVFSREIFHRGASGFSAFMSANGVGAAVGGLWLATYGERVDRRQLIYGGGLVFCILTLLFAATHRYQTALFLMAASGFAMIVFAISCNTKVQTDVPDFLRGRVMAIYSLVFNALMPLGGLEIAFLAERRHSPVFATQVNASLCVIVILALALWSQLDTRGRLKPTPHPESV